MHIKRLTGKVLPKHLVTRSLSCYPATGCFLTAMGQAHRTSIRDGDLQAGSHWNGLWRSTLSSPRMVGVLGVGEMSVKGDDSNQMERSGFHEVKRAALGSGDGEQRRQTHPSDPGTSGVQRKTLERTESESLSP